MTTPITHRLKSDNWDLHQIAERGGTPESMIKGTITREGFASYLGQAILIHRALDRAIDRAIEQMPELTKLVLDEQHFEPYFESDLSYYNASESTEPTPGTTRFIEHINDHIDQPLHIFGLHYVRLGACNGNRFVARKLRMVFGIDHPSDGMMSHDPFGDQQRTNWTAFKDGIDALDLSDTQRDELFEGTRAAYLMTINLDLEEFMDADQLLEAHGKTLDHKAFDEGHSVHVPAEQH